MKSPTITFGTDGWRGRIADDYTFDSVRRCAQGFADFLISDQGKESSVVIGHDKRFGSEAFARAAAEVMAGNGIHTYLIQGPSPTPVISHAVVANGASGAINITASHNPAMDNGFKVRNRHGGAIRPVKLKEIEGLIPPEPEDIPRLKILAAEEQGVVEHIDPAPAYIEQISNLVDLERIRTAAITVGADVMWGNGAGWFSKLLAGGSTQVHEFHNVRNPCFPDMTRPEPIPPNVDAGLALAHESGADVVLITDGDADRLGVGDENGEFIDQLRVYALLAYYLLEIRGERGPIVKTLSTTTMLIKLAEKYDVPLYETGVGFKYVAPKMLEVDAMIGGEESGGYAFGGHVPERDGILAGLYLLDLMVRTKKKPSELIELLFEIVGPHYYDRIDNRLDPTQREEYRARIEAADPVQIGGLRVLGQNRTDGYKFELEDGGWLLIRFSGTEPIVRVYCETTQQDRVQPILDDGLRIVGLK
jgi:phosphomannomutase